MMQPDAVKSLEDRVFKYITDLPDTIALMFARQLYRARGIRQDDIDGAIARALKKDEIATTCNCQNRHSTNTPFSHWISGDTP